ncbi:flagella synthesis protein FlgN [Pseudomonas sp. PLMAX]|jgi:flagella synthesis protein FlgN|uniref:flagella synthesis protein FlgN n=1 Tax=Pseudomonas sp. PLMAX TaxID=2201998 RepID=UPI0038BCFA72
MSFPQHLEARKKSLEEFLALLQEEQVLYSTSELPGDEIIELTKRKMELAGKVNTLNQQTNEGLRKLNYPEGREGAERLAAEQNCSALWEEIIQLALKAKLQNEVNGTLIQMRWEPTKQMTAFLQKASGTPLYGPNGKAQRKSLGGVNAQA